MATTIDTQTAPTDPRARFAIRTPQTAQDLEKLLRRRLIIIALLASLTTAFHALFRRSMPEQWEFFRSTTSGQYMLHYETAFFFAGLVAAVVLWRRRSWSIRALRAFEFGAIGMFTVYIGWTQTIAWSGARIPTTANGEYDTFLVRQFVDSMAVRWLSFIIGIATLVPETWRYLPGLTLDQIVKSNGPLPPARAIHFLRQMCAALHEAHAIGLIHRDIKPANIIAGERGGVFDVAKLLDFGLVRHTDEHPGTGGITQDGALLGTPAYMSPEQVDARVIPDQRTDIYSLGAVGYFLLTGQPPFVRNQAMELMIAHARDPVSPPRSLRPDIPPDLEGVIMRCLAKNVDERFTSVAELDAALEACEARDSAAN